MAQLQHAIVPKCRPGVGTKYLISKDVQDIRLDLVLNFKRQSCLSQLLKSDLCSCITTSFKPGVKKYFHQIAAET